MDVVFLRQVWLYLPDGSKERIIAQTGDNTGISFDTVHAGVEVRRYFKYSEYSITQTERGDYVVSPVDGKCDELKFTDGPTRFHVSDDYDAPVRKVCRYFTGEWCIWYESEDGGEAFLTFDEKRYELTLCDDTLYVTEKCDDIFDITEKNGGGVEDDVHENVVSHPSHYAALTPEPITFIHDKDYPTGSALKYIFRAGHKNGADENIDIGKAGWYLREVVNERGGQTVIAILRGVYWDTIDRQLTPKGRAREIRDRLTEFMSAISHDRLSDYIPEEK